ncbi:tRNA lysidine(34) synthetase TilS [Halomonas sp. 328]|uniref:tRNA lysidine(34) synthetase TilS n=1 Tax=Halomonas sp. 328 TaxID=2776704 RepID=UPI0018A6F8A1|nr:tRNA lysidine(34) synthetase TilS [Halomonas sp. 328]MBF8222381.1 tRNA lysidine(34) synthetase TilS [Halomonas sp. 328]
MSLQALIDDALAETPPGRVVWVAFSGGLDSSLLLSLAAKACRRHPRPLYALHVHHGLQEAADGFEAHCRRLCSRLGVPLFVERVRVDGESGLGLEGAAREARYGAFAGRVAPGETLWLAQHRDDQAETLLLAALRGSGVRGLAAMPASRDWRGRYLQRPLLGVSRAELRRVAEGLGLAWVEDPSNAETRQDRNYLRHAVLPCLEARWPGAAARLSRTAARAGEADALLGELAAEQLAALGNDPARLPVAGLVALSWPRQRLLLRHACERLGLSPPPAARLETLLAQLASRPDAEVRVAWPGAEARCWRGALYLLAPQRPLASDWSLEWSGAVPLPGPRGALAVALQRAEGETPALVVRPRLGGERLRLAGRGRRDLKRLLQEWGLPPWRRQWLLVAWAAGEPVAVLEAGEARWLAVAEGWRGRGPGAG